MPDELGFSGEKLVGVESWLRASNSDTKFRVVIARHGYLAGSGIKAWTNSSVRQPRRSLTSPASWESPPIRVGSRMHYYPEMMGVGEEPGQVFHYQTIGMNILTNGIATIYGLYDGSDSDRLPGCGKLIGDYIRDPIQATWSYSFTDFDHPPRAKKNILGNSLRVVATARETARTGHLWLNWGSRNGEQVVQEAYLREVTFTNRFILEQELEENWKYGHGFWVNDHGKQWRDLPRDSFAGAKHIWVCPRLGLVVSQSPGTWNAMKEEAKKVAVQNEIRARILDAVED